MSGELDAMVNVVGRGGALRGMVSPFIHETSQSERRFQAACAAMTGLLANAGVEIRGRSDHANAIGEAAVELADALLVAMQEKGE